MTMRMAFGGTWVLLLAACVLLVSVVDAVLLELSQTLFTAGYNGVHLRGAGPLVGFTLSSLLVDGCLVVGVWAGMLAVLAGRGGTALQKLAVVSACAIAVPLSVDFVRYEVGQVLGRAVALPVLWEVSGGSAQLVLSEVTLRAGPLVAVLVAAGAAVAALVWYIGRLERSRGGGGGTLPRARPMAFAFAATLFAASVALVATASFAPRVYAGLSAKPSASVLIGAIQLASDVDRDGFGLLSRPADADPFDGSRHPWAVEVPGNGIDENGLAGDLPRAVRPLEPVPTRPVAPEHTRRPDFLLVYLESFRADRLGATRNGRAITPFLDALAREGSKSDRAYVNSPYTIWSRAQLFGGVLSPEPGQRTLVDDFKALGYTVAHLSGQDDSFGRSVELLGLDRVDHFYDARQDLDLRTSRSTSAGGLQVSWKLLTRRVGEYLDGFDPARPLFLYVNLVDTHFPYTHDEVDDLLGVAPITRGDIRVANAEAVRAAYDNTSANVDLAIRQLVERFRRATGGRDHAILVASDHGQALFEGDMLGHGRALTDEQTRTPFVLWGVGGAWPEPLAMADVRGLLARNLFAPRADTVPRATWVPDPSRRIFHYVAQIDHPHLVGLRTLSGLTSFALRESTFELFDANGQPRRVDDETAARAFDELIFTWEATRRALEDETRERWRSAPGPA